LITILLLLFPQIQSRAGPGGHNLW